MKLTWFGLSCFLIEGSQASVLMDPFDDTCGYEVPSVHADVWTSSHDHYDHNYRGAIVNDDVVRGEVGTQVRGVRVGGVKTFHDRVQGAEWGDNMVYTIELDGLRIAHLGDLGHVLSRVQLAELGKIDLLLVPVGGIYTVDAADAAIIAKDIGARLTIPMHYSTYHLQGFELHQGVDDFLIRTPCRHLFAHSSELIITEELLREPTVCVLELA